MRVPPLAKGPGSNQSGLGPVRLQAGADNRQCQGWFTSWLAGQVRQARLFFGLSAYYYAAPIGLIMPRYVRGPRQQTSETISARHRRLSTPLPLNSGGRAFTGLTLVPKLRASASKSQRVQDHSLLKRSVSQLLFAARLIQSRHSLAACLHLPIWQSQVSRGRIVAAMNGRTGAGERSLPLPMCLWGPCFILRRNCCPCAARGNGGPTLIQ